VTDSAMGRTFEWLLPKPIRENIHEFFTTIRCPRKQLKMMAIENPRISP